MKTFELPLAGGGIVVVERTDSAPAYDGVVTRGPSVQAAVERVEQTFEAALGTVRAVAENVVSQLAGLRVRPDTVTVEFGVALAAKAGAIITAGGSSHLQVTLVWQGSDRAAPLPGPPPGAAGEL
ncbi:CU044_2847 family protein [Streptomyces stramineus]|uniref:Trypsin-co-occurring domain-containing protein n=1 Tax=Streptomyces stramineus TaxID=173861 RepID=A0ABN1AKG7_9ACTN